VRDIGIVFGDALIGHILHKLYLAKVKFSHSKNLCFSFWPYWQKA